MKLDKFANPIFNQSEVFDALYTGDQTLLSNIIVEDNYEFSQLAKIADISFLTINSDTYSLSIEEFDAELQDNWFMPDEYYRFDVKEFCLSKCQSIEEQTRVIEELEEFSNRKMIKVLQWLKYFVDLCLSENIIWGVGRGSSVSSFVLYLLDVHKIHSIKYNLDWHDFLR